MSIINKIILLFSILLYANISNAYDYSILLLAPTNQQTEVIPSGVLLTWQTSPNISSSNNLKYVIKVMTIDESEQIPSSLDNYCSSCTNVVDNVISFQSESGSYTFNAETCKKYIWQVTLIEDIPASTDPDGNPVPASQQIRGQSAVNSFTTNCNINQRLISAQTQFMTFPTEYTSYVYGIANNNSIYFKYESEYNDQTINYKIYDNLHKTVKKFGSISSTSSIPTKIHKGVNYLEIELDNTFISGQVYFLEVTNAKDIVKSLKFRIEQ